MSHNGRCNVQVNLLTVGEKIKLHFSGKKKSSEVSVGVEVIPTSHVTFIIIFLMCSMNPKIFFSSVK